MPDGARLYEEDFFAWTQDQAARLRALPPEARGNGLDVEHLAEEIEDMGRSERRALRSQLANIALHLLKLEFLPDRQPAAHWRSELSGFRAEVEELLADSPSLRPRLPAEYAEAWTKAVRQFAPLAEAAEVEPSALSPRVPRYDLEDQILNPDWLPPYDR
jgi:hypothetical protein